MHENNREHFLKLNGTDFIQELSCFVLENSSSNEMSQITRIDAKILNLCVLSTHVMLKEYPKLLLQKPFSERVALFE